MATAAEILAIRGRLGSILMSPAAQKINFFLDRFHVDGSGLSFVALALLSKPRNGHGLSIHVARQAHFVEASYHPSTNSYEVPSAGYGTTPFQRMSMVHESVHALRDTFGSRLRTSTGRSNTLALTDEAAAFLAGALFHIFDTTPAGAVPVAPSFAQGTDVYAVAHQLAVKIRDQMGFAVTPQDSKALRDAVMGHAAYRALKNNPKQSYGNNGLSL